MKQKILVALILLSLIPFIPSASAGYMDISAGSASGSLNAGPFHAPTIADKAHYYVTFGSSSYAASNLLTWRDGTNTNCGGNGNPRFQVDRDGAITFNNFNVVPTLIDYHHVGDVVWMTFDWTASCAAQSAAGSYTSSGSVNGDLQNDFRFSNNTRVTSTNYVWLSLIVDVQYETGNGNNVVAFVWTPTPNPPAAPTLTYYQSSCSQGQLNWTVPSANDTIDGYKVTDETNATSFVVGTSPRIFLVSPNGNYWHVSAHGHDSGYGTNSSSIQATNSCAIPPAPILSLDSFSCSGGVYLSWTAINNPLAPTTGYLLNLSNAGYRGFNSSTLTAHYPPPSTNTSYSVAAQNSIGIGNWSASVSVVPYCPLFGTNSTLVRDGGSQLANGWFGDSSKTVQAIALFALLFVLMVTLGVSAGVTKIVGAAAGAVAGIITMCVSLGFVYIVGWAPLWLLFFFVAVLIGGSLLLAALFKPQQKEA